LATIKNFKNTAGVFSHTHNTKRGNVIMEIHTGKIVSMEEVKRLQVEEQANYITVERNMSEVEKLSMQIELYSPCACGSGRKFKFCCHKK
jgi:uncharacterized protein YchJ